MSTASINMLREVSAMADGWQQVCGASSGSSASAAGTLVALLEVRAAAPRGGYLFLQDGQVPHAGLSFPDLAHRARAIAVDLRRRIAPGSRALLLYPAGLSFLPAFFGCLYA